MRRKPLILEKVITITVPPFYEELFSTPIDIPTTQPPTPQFSKLISQEELPQSNIGIDKFMIILRYDTVIRNTTTTTAYLYYSMVKNGTVIRSKWVLAYANYYITLTFGFSDIKPGDKIELYLWANLSGLQQIWQGWAYLVSRPKIFTKYIIQYLYLEAEEYPRYSLGRPLYDVNYFYLEHKDLGSIPFTPNIRIDRFTYAKIINGAAANPNYGLIRVHTGDYVIFWDAEARYSTTYYPRYMQDRFIKKIVVRAYRE